MEAFSTEELEAVEGNYQSYDALAAENVQLMAENFQMYAASLMAQNAQLLRENMMLRMQPHIVSIPPPPGLTLDCASEQSGDSRRRSSASAGSSRSTSATSRGSDEEKVLQDEEQIASSTRRLTTIMMKNIPNNMSRDQLLDVINAEGFAGLYDFVYLPIDFKTSVGLGYSFINFEDPEVADRFRFHFQGFSWDSQSKKVCKAVWSESLQGREAHIERYRNSPVMHHSMPANCKPVLFENGKMVPFPARTARVRAPRYYSHKH